MINVLVNAYACAPNMGSEPGMAWNWIINLAKYCKLYVITEGEWKNEIESTLLTSEIKDNVQFYYLPVSDEIRQMCWNQGDWRFYYHYRRWQKKAYKQALEIIKNHPIDILHQLNMIGFREPGYLWKIKTIPFVWGPIDAKEGFPVLYLKNASFKIKLFIKIKNRITQLQLLGSYRVKQAIKNANEVFSASSNTKATLSKYFNRESILLNETGCYVSDVKNVKFSNQNETLNLLWVGKFDFRKQLELALLVIEKLKHLDIIIHIVGKNDDEEGIYFQKVAFDLGISDKCKWYGLIPHQKVQELMQFCDLFFFTSVAEGTPHVVLESIGNKLPVVCFNTCGQGDVINENVGAKVELSTMEKSIEEFTSILSKFYKNRTMIRDLSDACEAHQVMHSWNQKAKIMVDTYKKILAV